VGILGLLPSKASWNPRKKLHVVEYTAFWKENICYLYFVDRTCCKFSLFWFHRRRTDELGLCEHAPIWEPNAKSVQALVPKFPRLCIATTNGRTDAAAKRKKQASLDHRNGCLHHYSIYTFVHRWWRPLASVNIYYNGAICRWLSLTYKLENLISNVQWHDEYLWQVLLKSGHLEKRCCDMRNMCRQRTDGQTTRKQCFRRLLAEA